MAKVVARFVKCEAGATAIEYGLMASLIGIAIIATVKLLTINLKTTFTKVTSNLT